MIHYVWGQIGPEKLDMKLNSIRHSLPHGLLSENSLCGTVYGGKICVYCYSLRIQAAHICGGVGLGDGNSVTFRGLKCHSKFFSNSWKNPAICNWMETERCFGKKGSRTRQPQIKQTKNFKCHWWFILYKIFLRQRTFFLAVTNMKLLFTHHTFVY